VARVGHGQAFGAVTVVNATATGVGCALAVAAATRATWDPEPVWGGLSRLTLKPDGDLRLVEAVAGDRPAAVTVECPFPPSRGLKTSSSVAAALVRAAADAEGIALGAEDVERLAVGASRRAGVTLTGAYDDQAAVVRGGCQLADTRGDRVLASLPVEPWQVALWVPERSIPKEAVRPVDVSSVRSAVQAAEDLARGGDIPGALTANGRAYHEAYAAAGLPVDDLPARVALRAGALGAGLSGTGPAVAALFTRRVPLPPVTGGAWSWTRVVPAT
jgi:shikimate kinase